MMRRTARYGPTWTTDAGTGLPKIIRWPGLVAWRAYVWLAMYARLLASLRRTGETFVKARHVGSDRLTDGAKVAVFAHHDPDGMVHDFVLHYLRALRDAGYAIVFVSNSPVFDTVSLQRVLPLSALVLHRVNVGYDFGAFKDGIAALGELSRFEQVVLANDSVYGPLFDLGEILARCDAGADIWGMTDNWAGGYHLQSYFLLLRRSALVCPAVSAFFRAVRPVQSKEWVIRRYEIGLTRAMRRAGLRCTALFPYRAAAAAFVETVRTGDLTRRPDLAARDRRYFSRIMRRLDRGKPLNAMHCFWRELVIRMHCPFLKRELLVYNLVGVPGVDGWRDIVRSASAYDTELAARHMRTLRYPTGSRSNVIEGHASTWDGTMTRGAPHHE